MRILFLTNTYSRTAVPYLRRLIEAGEDVVGIFLLERLALKKRAGLGVLVKKYGWNHIFKRLGEVVRARLRLWGRRLGARPRGEDAYQSVEEFLLDNTQLCSFTVEDFNSIETAAAIKALKPDVIFVSTLSQILKGDILRVAASGCVNIHAGLLPKYRGPASNFWVLYNNEEKTGVTFHYLAEKVDAGNIILQKELVISTGDTEETLDARLSDIGAQSICEVVAMIGDGRAVGTPQPEGDASYYPQPKARDRQALAQKKRAGSITS